MCLLSMRAIAHGKYIKEIQWNINSINTHTSHTHTHIHVHDEVNVHTHTCAHGHDYITSIQRKCDWGTTSPSYRGNGDWGTQGPKLSVRKYVPSMSKVCESEWHRWYGREFLVH